MISWNVMMAKYTLPKSQTTAQLTRPSPVQITSAFHVWNGQVGRGEQLATEKYP
jgi:hypothetical protein